MGFAVFRWVLAVLAALAACALPARAQTFSNPIGNGADPWVMRHEGQYLMCQSGGGGIRVSKAAKLEDIGRAPRTDVWKAPATGEWSKELWAPELHRIDGKWYVYVAADDGDNFNHRMYVLEGNTQDPQGAYTFKGKIAAKTDRWAIDGSVLTHGGKNYFIWSGWEGTANVKQDIYIAAMANPWTISGERVRISTPDLEWEKRGGSPSINEGPEALTRGGENFIIYSASGSWSDFYCLGRLHLTGKDPLDSASWSKHPQPVFSPTEEVFGPGHCSFTKSPDSSEDWIIYHAAVESGAGWVRNIRIQRFSWDAKGIPVFGEPIPTGVPQPVPANGSNGVRNARGGAMETLMARPGAGLRWFAPEGEDALGRSPLIP
jgi:GH43 family beta-xylosidase